jgi:site-specific DNA-methyltransferase (adenine-specific)
MMTKNSVHFSSKSAEWETPSLLFNWLDKKFRFDLDPAATAHNHKCDIYFTRKEDGIKRDWKICGDSAFLNPPYGNPEHPCKPNCKKKVCIKRGFHNKEYIAGIGDWVRKSYTEAQRGMCVVCLISARPDTGWWHEYCMKANEIWFIKGRVHFRNKVIADYTGKTKTSPAPFPSCIIIFDGLHRALPAKPVIRSLYINKRTGEIKLI